MVVIFIADAPVPFDRFTPSLLLLQLLPFDGILICIIGEHKWISGFTKRYFFIKFFVDGSLSDIIITFFFLGPFLVVDKASIYLMYYPNLLRALVVHK